MNKYIFFGLGAIGSNLLMQLIHLDKEAEFIGIDFDTVEKRNIATQAYLLPHIGMKKSQAMSVLTRMKRDKVNYISFPFKIMSVEDPQISSYAYDGACLLIDCFDNMESRKLLEGIPNCLHIGFSPKYTAEIIWGEKYSSPNDIKPEENDICEMDGAVPFINYVVSLAAVNIINYIKTGQKDSFLIQRIGKIMKLS